MREDEMLLRAVAANPDEDTPRLMYADWCEEHGDPARAEFIRLQVACGDRPAVWEVRNGDPGRVRRSPQAGRGWYEMDDARPPFEVRAGDYIDTARNDRTGGGLFRVGSASVNTHFLMQLCAAPAGGFSDGMARERTERILQAVGEMRTMPNARLWAAREFYGGVDAEYPQLLGSNRRGWRRGFISRIDGPSRRFFAAVRGERNPFVRCPITEVLLIDRAPRGVSIGRTIAGRDDVVYAWDVCEEGEYDADIRTSALPRFLFPGGVRPDLYFDDCNAAMAALSDWCVAWARQLVPTYGA